MISTIDETELARLEELAKDATPTPWMGAIDPSHFYTFSTILGGEKKQSRGLNHQLIVQVGGWATVREQQANTRYIAAACNAVPALIAEIRRLRRNYECSEKSLQRHEHMVAELLEKVEAWEWCNQVQHIYDNITFVLGLRQCAINELYTTLITAREAVHADRE